MTFELWIDGVLVVRKEIEDDQRDEQHRVQILLSNFGRRKYYHDYQLFAIRKSKLSGWTKNVSDETLDKRLKQQKLIK